MNGGLAMSFARCSLLSVLANILSQWLAVSNGRDIITRFAVVFVATEADGTLMSLPRSTPL